LGGGVTFKSLSRDVFFPSASTALVTTTGFDQITSVQLGKGVFSSTIKLSIRVPGRYRSDPKR